MLVPPQKQKAACYFPVDQGTRETPFQLEMTAGEGQGSKWVLVF